MAKTGYTVKLISAMTIADIKSLSEKELRKVYSTLAQATNKRVIRLREAGVIQYTGYRGTKDKFTVKDIVGKTHKQQVLAIGKLLGLLTSKGNTVRQARMEKKSIKQAWKTNDYDDEVVNEFKKLFGDESYYNIWQECVVVKKMTTERFMNYLKSEIKNKKKRYQIDDDEIRKVLGRI